MIAYTFRCRHYYLSQKNNANQDNQQSNKLVLSTYFGDNQITTTFMEMQDRAIPESIKQVCGKYICVSTIKGLEIFEIPSKTSVKKIEIQ